MRKQGQFDNDIFEMSYFSSNFIQKSRYSNQVDDNHLFRNLFPQGSRTTLPPEELDYRNLKNHSK